MTASLREVKNAAIFSRVQGGPTLANGRPEWGTQVVLLPAAPGLPAALHFPAALQLQLVADFATA